MIDVQPEQAAAEQKALHFLPSIVKHTGVPIRLDSLAWVGVLIEVRAVKEAQPVRIVGKVRRHPIENHPNAMLVQGVNEVHKILRGAVATGWRKKTRDLVAPGAVEGMLHDGQELDMREAQTLHILG